MSELINKHPIMILIGTMKGGFICHLDKERSEWELEGPIFLGNIINHLVMDPRDNKTILMAAKTGHLGPTIFRSVDFGKTWKEASAPPAFPKDPSGRDKRSVDYTVWLEPGHIKEPNVWYAGTSPHGLFITEDGGKTWAPVDGFNNNPNRKKWLQSDDGTPSGSMTHSITIDPRDSKHMYIGLSQGGVFESLDKGDTWQPLNQGSIADFLPNKTPEYGQDPHCLRLHPLKPDRLYQENHCGVYRMNRKEGRWIRIGNNLPKDIGDIGFPIQLHPRDPDTIWVWPMDGTDVWPRTSPDGKPAAYMSTDAGESWIRQDSGFPKQHAYFTVYRQAMSCDNYDPLGLYIGTTNGEVWASFDEGLFWQKICQYLPKITSIEVCVDRL